MVVHYKDVGPIHIRGGDRLEKLLHQRHSGLQLHRLLRFNILCSFWNLDIYTCLKLCVCVLLYLINLGSLYQLNCPPIFLFLVFQIIWMTIIGHCCIWCFFSSPPIFFFFLLFLLSSEFNLHWLYHHCVRPWWRLFSPRAVLLQFVF